MVEKERKCKRVFLKQRESPLHVRIGERSEERGGRERLKREKGRKMAWQKNFPFSLERIFFSTCLQER